MVVRIEEPMEKMRICREILNLLPEWFGIPESVEEYVKGSAGRRMWAEICAGEVRGFLVRKETSCYTAEIDVMGVKPQYHRMGVGRALFRQFRADTEAEGYEYIQVKTVREGCYPEYDRTNAFYKSLGFRELECFPMLWGEHNPCQIYIRTARKGDADDR